MKVLRAMAAYKENQRGRIGAGQRQIPVLSFGLTEDDLAWEPKNTERWMV